MVYTVDEATKVLKVSKSTVHKLIREGKLRTTRVGRQHRIPESEIVRLTTLPGDKEEREA